MSDRLAEPTEQKGFIERIPGYIAAGAIIIMILSLDDRSVPVVIVLGIIVWAGLHPSETMSVLESAAPVILLLIGLLIGVMVLFFVVGFAAVKIGGVIVDDE